MELPRIGRFYEERGGDPSAGRAFFSRTGKGQLFHNGEECINSKKLENEGQPLSGENKSYHFTVSHFNVTFHKRVEEGISIRTARGGNSTERKRGVYFMMRKNLVRQSNSRLRKYHKKGPPERHRNRRGTRVISDCKSWPEKTGHF